MKNARFARISSFRVFAMSGVLMTGALALMLSAGVAFAADPLEPGLDLPLDAPTAATPPQQAPSAPRPADPVDGDLPPKFFGHDIVSQGSIIYVIDQSGSMSLSVTPFTDENGKVVPQGNRLDRAKAELRKSILSLPTNFTFNVIFYDECVRPWQTSNVQADGSHKGSAFAFIASQQPMGFTNTGLAVATALTDKSNKNVVLLSDGEPNFLDCGMSYVGTFTDHRNLIKQANSQQARVDCFGIGVACDPDARRFMQDVASENGGNYIECN